MFFAIVDSFLCWKGKRFVRHFKGDVDKENLKKALKSYVFTAQKSFTVHEMARDEARHGKAFAGLLKRYFGE